MGFETREALRRLCDEIGWSYAVFWKEFGFPSPKHLVWDDGHWIGKLQFSRSNDVNSHFSYLAEFQSLGEGSIDELGYQVHGTTGPCYIVVGIVGQAASTGNHCWILRNDSESTLKLLRNYIDYCTNKGAIIHCTIPYPQARPVMDDLIRLHGPRFTPIAAAMPSDLKVTEDFLASVNSECFVCMENFKIGDVATQLRYRHVHHKECIAGWLEIRNSCPLCRESGTGDRETNFLAKRFTMTFLTQVSCF